MPDAPSPDWRDSGNNPAQPGGAKPWQPDDTAPGGPSALPSKRGMKRIVALVALVVLAVVIGLVFYWLQRPKPACLVLIGSGYESNLLLPHNVHGWNGLRAMEKEVALKDDYKELFRLPWDPATKMHQVGDGPVELKEQGWQEMWDKLNIASYKEKTVVVFISLHGMADDQKAYLIPNISGKQKKTFTQARIPFEDVLDSLKKVKGKKIVLLLDVSQVEANWPTGMLHNDFVARLQEKYDKEITANDNLVVICSAGADQRSWASDELQRTIFAQFVADGLKGTGQRKNTNVTAWTLFDQVKTNVDAWAQTNRARKQTPILLGGESRAKGIDLVYLADVPEAKTPPTPAFDLDALRNEWNKWKDLKQTQAPQVHSPQVWRLYQDTLLRYEQLLRAGDPTGRADDVKKNLEKLHGDLTASRSLAGAYVSMGNSFPMYRVLGYRPEKDLRDPALQEFLTSLRQLDNAKPESQEERNKLLGRFRERSQQEKQFLRTRFGQLILKDSFGKLSRERDRLAEIENELGAPQRPVETQLLKMLQDADEKLDPATIKLALDVRMLAEETALSAVGDTNAELYAEAIYPWIRAAVENADKDRRAGEDLLFGDPTVYGAAAYKKLDEARKQYEQARGQAKKLQAAFALRDDAAAELPYLAVWLATASSEQNKEELQNLRLATQGLGLNLYKLNQALNAADRKALPPDSLVAEIDADVKTVREAFQDTCEKLKTLAGQQKNWHAIEAALSAPPPGMDVALRIDLLRRQRDISSKLLKNTDLEGKTEKDEPIETRAKRQRDLLRACVRPVDEIKGFDKENVDDKTREFFFARPAKILENTNLADGVGPDLVNAADECRVIPGAFADQLKDETGKRVNPVDRLRRLRLANLFCALAERTLEDHWFEPGIKREEPYYDFAGKTYLTSARGLFDDGQIPEAFAKKLDKLKNKFALTKLRIGKLKELYWTTESNFSFDYAVAADKNLPQGTPMVWLEVTAGKVPQKAWPRKAMKDWPNFKDAFLLDRSKFAGAGDITLNLHVYYRGQHLLESSPAVRSQPDVIARHFPVPKEASFAVRMDSTFDYGAISIVLDNSGSMSYRHPKKGEKDVDANRKAGENRRFDYALDALRHVLKKVPDNTELSIFTLGKKKEGGGFETGATTYREPTPWRQKNEFNELFASLDGIPGDIASPIAATMIKSMNEGFSKGFNGPKVIVVLTDGDDNASFKDETVDRTKRIVDELKVANELHPDIVVVFVCFVDKNADEESAEEFKSATAQFKGVENFKLRGHFLDVPQGEKLGGIIEDLIRPRTQLIIGKEAVRQPINYYSDSTLKWKNVPPGVYAASVPRTLANQQTELNLDPAQKLFMVLTRDGEKLTLRRGLLGNQPETEKRGGITKEKTGWFVWLLLENENTGLMTSVLKQLIVFEKKESKEDIKAQIVRQTYPGFVWLELDAADGQKPDKTLYWWKDWSVPAPAFRVEMRDWPAGTAPRLGAWFWPNEKDSLLSAEKLVTRVRRSIPHREPINGAVGAAPVIEGVEWDDNREVETPAGEKIKRKCLVVRVRYPEGKPVWVDLDQRSPDIGSEHHYFTKARTCTAYFYGPELDAAFVNLLLFDIAAFKTAAEAVSFAPEGRIEASRWFGPKVP